MDESNRTDKEILTKGLKQLLICLIFMFLGPSLIHLALNNQDKSLFIVLLIIAFIFCIIAIILLAKGINTILDSMFNKKS
ncbi:DUF6095 family protein [uncultured Winogradskyella sp.]|uniref:DUF6095 family protein n=1 Tax=Winogradskyella sp. 4-2091 TaxID=3381659 RepID=UPI0026058346|nr:DUF6095 family protein [uncultured Winogradskyella sp.]